MSRSSLSEKQYHYIRNNSPKLRAWRTPGRTRLLATIYFAGLAVAALSWLGMLATVIGLGGYLVFYIAPLLASMVAFTMLRLTIDGKDLAPPDQLDDYEREIMGQWHDRSHRIFETVLFVGAFLFIGLATFAPDALPPAALGVSAGLYMMFTYLAVGTLPTVGFATTFNSNANDQAEELY